MNEFGTRIRSLRIKNEMTQWQVAFYLHIDRTTYAGYESGKRFPDAHTLCKIADLFNVSTDFLLNHNVKP